MERTDLPRLDYRQAPQRTAGWGIASACAGVNSIFALIAMVVVVYLSRAQGPPGGSTYPRTVVTTAIVAAFWIGPILGVTCGAIGLRSNTRGRAVALLGIILSLTPWAILLLTWVVSHC